MKKLTFLADSVMSRVVKFVDASRKRVVNKSFVDSLWAILVGIWSVPIIRDH